VACPSNSDVLAVLAPNSFRCTPRQYPLAVHEYRRRRSDRRLYRCCDNRDDNQLRARDAQRALKSPKWERGLMSAEDLCWLLALAFVLAMLVLSTV
jgi:hypothetical protein